MQKHLDDFSRFGARVLVISFGRPEVIEGFRTRLGIPFPVASDPEQKAYRDYGIGKASVWTVWSPRVLWKYLKLAASGRKPQHSEEPEDVYQLGGDFLLDEKGVILFAHVSRNPVDRPEVRDILKALAKGGSVQGA